VAIDKFPLRDGTYTALATTDGAGVAQVAGQLEAPSPRESEARPQRVRDRARTTSLRVRSADRATNAKPAPAADAGTLTREQALEATPHALRETVELFWLKTGRAGLTEDDLAALRDLDQAHTPAVIQKAITEAVERFARRGASPQILTFRYVWESLRGFTTRRSPKPAPDAGPDRPVYPPGLTRLH
jgi:hypothetical protein